MVIKRNTRDVVPTLSAAPSDQRGTTSTRLDILQEIVERVMKDKPMAMKAIAGISRSN